MGDEPDAASAVWSQDGAAPVELLRAAESVGQGLVDRAATAPLPAEPAWSALPERPLAPPPARERRVAIARLLAWARAAGASWDGIEFHVDASGDAGVRASRTLSSGETILTVPRHLMIVDDELASSTDAVALDLPEPRPRDALAAWLPLEARDPASRWRPYLDALPVQLAELPMFRDEGDLAQLTGTVARACAAEENHHVHTTYGRLSPELRARISLADFAWGSAIVLSRAFRAPGADEPRIALIPLMDMFNHAFGDTMWRYHPAVGFEVSLERDVAIGEEVHFAYGIGSNAHLFAYYGFAVQGNTSNEAALLFDHPDDPVNRAAAHLMWHLPLEVRPRIRVGCMFDERFQRALSLARLHASGAAERACAVATGLTPVGDLPWLGAALEEAALDVLAAAARRALAELDELSSLATRTPPGLPRAWDRTCTIARDGERAVLEQIVEFTGIARALLDGRDPGRTRAAAGAIAWNATGARRLARQYLRAVADEAT